MHCLTALGAVGSTTPAMHCLTAWGQCAVQLLQCAASLPWGSEAVQLLQCTAPLPGGSGECNSCNALPHCLGAVGSATPAMHCLTAWGQWVVRLLQCTAPLLLLKPQANTQTRGKTRTSPVAHLVSVPPPRGQSQKPGMGNRSRK